MERDNSPPFRLYVNVDPVAAFAAVEMKTPFLKDSNDLLGRQRWGFRHASLR